LGGWEDAEELESARLLLDEELEVAARELEELVCECAAIIESVCPVLYANEIVATSELSSVGQVPELGSLKSSERFCTS